jgi:hypothetical protein
MATVDSIAAEQPFDSYLTSTRLSVTGNWQGPVRVSD